MLTAAQLATLKSAIAANTNTILISGVATAINSLTAAQLNDPAFAQAVCDQWYNLDPSTPFYGYYTGVPVSQLNGAIRWNRLTPSDAVTATNYTQISLACQGCQFNIQLLLGFQQTVDATQRTIVQGFHDSCSAVPSAGAGATQDAGWSSTPNVPGALTIPQVLSRQATNAEVLFAVTTAWGQGGSGASQTPGSTGPATLTFQGALSGIDITAAINGGYQS